MIKREKSDECDCLDDISTALGRLISDIIMNVGAACHILVNWVNNPYIKNDAYACDFNVVLVELRILWDESLLSVYVVLKSDIYYLIEHGLDWEYIHAHEHELITCKFILESERLIILPRVTISGGMKADSIPGGAVL